MPAIDYDEERTVLANVDGRIVSITTQEPSSQGLSIQGDLVQESASQKPSSQESSTQESTTCKSSNQEPSTQQTPLDGAAALTSSHSENQNDNVSRETFVIRRRLYVTGWAKRGPIGLIGSTKSDSLAVVQHMLEDWSQSPTKGRYATDRDPKSIDHVLSARGIDPIDMQGWKRVDAFEKELGAKEGRYRKKVVDGELLRNIARGKSI